MRKYTKFIVVAGALVALAAPSAAMANASGIGGLSSVSGFQSGTPQGGKNMTVTQYKTSYTNETGVNWSCSGVHQVSKSSGTDDSFTCNVSDLASVLNWAPLGTSSAAGRWQSDFTGELATGGTITVIDNGNGTATINGFTTYNS
jgi:hypothetical protein